MEPIAKTVAMRLDSAFRGHTRVVEYRDEVGMRSIDVLLNEETEGTYIGTIGGFRVPLPDANLENGNFLSRFELVTLVRREFAGTMACALSSVFFEILQRPRSLFPGCVVRDVLFQYDDQSLPHLYLTKPFFDGDWSPVLTESFSVSFLIAVPVSNREVEFLDKYGAERFENELMESKFDYSDLHRRSIM